MVPDTEPSASDSSLEVTPITVPPAKKPRKSHAWVITFALILVILIAAGGYLFWLWKNYEAQKQALLQKELGAMQTSWVNTHAQLANQGHQIELIQQSLQQIQHQNWPLAQAQYLIKLATYNLTFENNAALAAQILKAADAQLQATNDLSLLPTRQAIASDIAELQAVPSVDIGGIITTLNAVSAQIEKLPTIQMIHGIKSGAAVPAITEHGAQSAAHVNSWKIWFAKFSQDVWRVLQSMVVIHHDKPQAAPLLPPEQYVYIVTNIQSQLALAQWAALHQQSAAYQQSLKLALAWINRYFPSNAAAVTAVVAQLQALSKISVKPAMPDLSRSLQAIAQAMDKAS